MKKFLSLFVICLLFTSCQRMNLGPKGEGEYVMASAEVPFVEGSVSAMKEEGLVLAEKAAVEKAARVFLSSNSLIEYPERVKTDILANYKNYVRRSYVNSSYRKGDKFYVEGRVMVLVSDLAAKVKEIEDSAYVRKTNILVASRELINGEVSLKQYCRQGVYKALKNFPYTLLDGGTLSENNLTDTTSFIDKAKKEGARFVIIAEADAAPLESAAALTTTFKPIRAKVNLKVMATSNYQLVAQAAENASGLDAVQNLAEQKALTNACQTAAEQVEEAITQAINSATTFKFIIINVNTIERLEKLQNIMRSQRDVEDFALVKYRNSTATFSVQAKVSTAEEFSAKILRKNVANFTVVNTSADSITMEFI